MTTAYPGDYDGYSDQPDPKPAIFKLEKKLGLNNETFVNIIEKGADKLGVDDFIAAYTNTSPPGALQDLGSGGGIVFFPKGGYMTNSQIVLPSHVWFRGAGRLATTIQAGPSFPAPATISSVTTDMMTHVATFTTSSAHGLSAGMRVIISGVSVATYNGTWAIATVPTSTTFTVQFSSTIASGSGGSVVAPFIILGDGTHMAFHCQLRDLTIDCNNLAGSIGVYSSDIQEQSGLRNVEVINFGDTGFMVDNASGNDPANFHVFDCQFNSGSNTPNYGILFNGGAGPSIMIQRVTVNTGGDTHIGKAGVALSSSDGSRHLAVRDLHVERYTDGILIDSSGSLSVHSLSGQSTVTNDLHIGPNFTGMVAAIGIRPARSTGYAVFDERGVKTLTAATESGTTATFTTSANHGFSVGQQVQVSGVTPSGYNGIWIITSTTSTTFTVVLTTSGLGNGTAFGTVTTYLAIPTAGNINIAEYVVSKSGGSVSNRTVRHTAGNVAGVPWQHFEEPTRFINGLATFYKSAAGVTVSDADFATTPPDGTLAVARNTTTAKDSLWVRSNGAWKKLVEA